MPSTPDNIAKKTGSGNIKKAHDALNVGTGAPAWYAFYSSALGKNGSLADLMYEYWKQQAGQ